MNIQTKLSKEDYKSASLATLVSNTKLKVFLGIFLLIIIINLANALINSDNIIVSLIPLIIIWGAMFVLYNFSINRAYKNNPRINELITYQFEEQRLLITGESFTSEMSWDRMHRITKTKKWLLLWHNSQMANVIPMKDVPAELIDQLQNIAKRYKLPNNL